MMGMEDEFTLAPLAKTLRNKLESKVQEAREIAELAARSALEQLGVSESSPYQYLPDEERALWHRLRAHGRQLGDERNDCSEEQAIELLLEEVAYQHWHRMLFARFLAENHLLMYPDPVQAVPISLEECDDLAPDEGARNGWELAARYAALMLPQIFRVDSPVFELELPPEYQQRLEQVLSDLPQDVFTASDSLGWVYQFWQAKKKEQINDAGVKIGARELPAVTQLFTEDYMVSFLLDNSLGAWWAGRRLSPTQLQSAASEDELRRILILPGISLQYLRFIKDETDGWTPAAGIFSGWPDRLSELKVLDPCCGSGHFLVAAFLMLVPMRIEMDGLTAQEAVDAVLRENLHGLEIDQRCLELAAFALALNAWCYPGAGGYRLLPELNLACTGLSNSAKREDWLTLAGNDVNLQITLERLYNQFVHAPLLGSLIIPELGKDTLFESKWDDVVPVLTKVLSGEADDYEMEMGVTAFGMAKAATLLAATYNLVITNVPYLTRGKHSDILMEYIDNHFFDARKDLAAVFLDRIQRFISCGTACLVIPQNLLQLTGYTLFRKKLLLLNKFDLIAKLGTGAFETISGENVAVVLLIETIDSNIFNHKIRCIDASQLKEPAFKIKSLIENHLAVISQEQQIKNPDSRVIIREDVEENELLSDYANGIHGLGTKDAPMFIRNFWELPLRSHYWEYLQASISNPNIWSGMENIIFWQEGKGELHERAKVGKAILAGSMAYGKPGVLVSPVGTIRISLYYKTLFDKSTAVICPNDETDLVAIYCFLDSPEFRHSIKQIDSKIAITNKTLVKVPFDLEYWHNVAAEKYPHGLPQPYSEDPTQWIFHGHPAKSEATLQVAMARLLGYRWPAELDAEIELSAEARALISESQNLLAYADKDGIVCIPAVGGNAPAAERLLNLLAAAYGEQWSNVRLSELLAQADHASKSLETWLRDKFFVQHCQLFQHRPFIWQIWDGLRDGFSVLVNYHRLDRKNLEVLIYSYLGDWITRQKDELRSGVDGAGEKLAAAENLKKKLELILEGEKPYDIFVRWKTIQQQPIGWEPDLNDGIRLNIRPFMSVPDVGKKGAGCLRDKPNVKWDKDRGKDVETAPWYHLFNGDRINDHHLSREEKRAARESDK